MEYTTEQLNRKIRTQELICLVNGWLLEHYEEQKHKIEEKEKVPPGQRDQHNESREDDSRDGTKLHYWN